MTFRSSVDDGITTTTISSSTVTTYANNLAALLLLRTTTAVRCASATTYDDGIHALKTSNFGYSIRMEEGSLFFAVRIEHACRFRGRVPILRSEKVVCL